MTVPNWKYWNNRLVAELYAAVVLTCNQDPSEVFPFEKVFPMLSNALTIPGALGRFGSFEDIANKDDKIMMVAPKGEISRRLRIALEHAMNPEFSRLKVVPMVGIDRGILGFDEIKTTSYLFGKVSLKDFSKWAQSKEIGWSIPDEFPFANRPTAVKNQKNRLINAIKKAIAASMDFDLQRALEWGLEWINNGRNGAKATRAISKKPLTTASATSMGSAYKKVFVDWAEKNGFHDLDGLP